MIEELQEKVRHADPIPLKYGLRKAQKPKLCINLSSVCQRLLVLTISRFQSPVILTLARKF